MRFGVVLRACIVSQHALVHSGRLHGDYCIPHTVSLSDHNKQSHNYLEMLRLHTHRPTRTVCMYYATLQ